MFQSTPISILFDSQTVPYSAVGGPSRWLLHPSVMTLAVFNSSLVLCHKRSWILLIYISYSNHELANSLRTPVPYGGKLQDLGNTIWGFIAYCTGCHRLTRPFL